MTSHLALVADNARPAGSRPGYRQALATGVCQKCHLASPGVRTVGIRRRDEPHWTRLALCPQCIADGRAQGYAVLS